jgi:hypothetical protein
MLTFIKKTTKNAPSKNISLSQSAPRAIRIILHQCVLHTPGLPVGSAQMPRHLRVHHRINLAIIKFHEQEIAGGPEWLEGRVGAHYFGFAVDDLDQAATVYL